MCRLRYQHFVLSTMFVVLLSICLTTRGGHVPCAMCEYQLASECILNCTASDHVIYGHDENNEPIYGSGSVRWHTYYMYKCNPENSSSEYNCDNNTNFQCAIARYYASPDCSSPLANVEPVMMPGCTTATPTDNCSG